MGAVVRSGMGVILPCGFIRGEIQSCLEVTGSDFSLVNLWGMDFILNWLYTINVTREPRKSLPPSQAEDCRARSLRWEGGPLGDALVISAQDE